MDIIRMVRGTSKRLNLHLIDRNGKAIVAAPTDRIIFGVKKSYADEEYTVKKVALGSDVRDGYCHMTIHPEDTIDFDPGRYFYDIGYKKGEEFAIILKSSEFEIQPNVTSKRDIDNG